MNQLDNGSGLGPCAGDVRPRGTQFGRLLVTGLLAAVLVAAPSSMAMAENDAAEVGKESGLGAAAALSSLIYGPVKILYATGGVITGGLAYAFTAGDSEVASKIFTRSLRGNYVITPEILTGEETLVFIGRDAMEPSSAPTASVASATPAYEDTDYDDLGW